VRHIRHICVVGAVAAATILAACGTDPIDSGEASATDTPTETTEDLSASEPVLRFDNWPLYIDVDDDDENLRPTLEAFTEETGIDVEYVEAVNDNDEYYAKISPALSAGQAPGADVFVVTDWMVARLIKQGWLQPLDKDNLSNVEENLDPALASPSFDPERTYSVPWQSGVTGIAYDSEKLPDGVTSWEQLLTDPELAGKVTLLRGMRESLPVLAGAQGGSMESFTEDDVQAALDAVQSAVDAGQIRAFTGNEYVEDLASGNVVAAMAWSGDVFQLQLDNPNLKFVVPEEGGELWSDNLVVPVGATHKSNAEQLMDFYYQPEVAAELAAWVNYISPVPAAKDAMLTLADEEEAEDPEWAADLRELAESPAIFPSGDYLSNVGITRDFTSEEEERYEQAWNEIVN
jgi:spermidine/putrescine transport system substrate-binding protein